MRRILVVAVLVLISCSPAATGPNRPPTATIRAPALAPEGSPVPFTATDASDPDGDAMLFTWRFGDGDSLATRERSVGHVYRNNGAYQAILIVSDSRDGADTSVATITIANVAPQLTVFSVPDTIVAQTPALVEIRYADPGLDDTVRATLWLQRPGVAEGGPLTGPGVIELVITDPGAYGISVILQDNDGATTSRDRHFTVVPATSPSGQGR